MSDRAGCDWQMTVPGERRGTAMSEHEPRNGYAAGEPSRSAATPAPAPARPARRRSSILRPRAGAAVALVLVIVATMIGRWMATLFSLGWGFAGAIAIVATLLLAIAIMRLPGRIYALTAALLTLLVGYTAYDFARNAMDVSQGLSFALALVPAFLVAAAFWDFRRLTREFTAWADGRI
ncbi:hypothetical protein MWN34_07465 [Ancylobacter sp. 6x-1]|uniref:Uncharacterized protein n=1 Tax=Ancylobacter crimeensis TaxID=2579147 RepID=A0ABT0D9X0_9HYPH|nr:hypothetical protein [Ancylobacter crimeensis]MCK0196750.1 hypothetical protein [Ancylobacter crimeensis]